MTVVSLDSYEVHYPGWGTQHNHATSRKCLRHKDYDFDLDADDAPRPAALWTRKPPPGAAEPRAEAEAPSRKRPRPDDATAESARLRKELAAMRAATQRLEQDLRASEARAAELSKQNETTEAWHGKEPVLRQEVAAAAPPILSKFREAAKAVDLTQVCCYAGEGVGSIAHGQESAEDIVQRVEAEAIAQR